MKIPAEVIVEEGKLHNYLLVPRDKNDKARFLAQAGFTQDNPEALEFAIRRLFATHVAEPDRTDEYGEFYRVEGFLEGPDGILEVVVICLRQSVDGVYRFITLKPAR